MAVILPSLVAPIRMRWIVAGRCVVLLNIRGRCSATFTGRPGCTRPKCCEQRVGTREQLSAEAAADERRVEANIFLRYAKSLGHIGGIPGNHLVQLPGVGFSDELHRQTEMSA